jgi:hypothetical protein
MMDPMMEVSSLRQNRTNITRKKSLVLPMGYEEFQK